MADVSVLFGGGRNTKARTADIKPEECAEGENFDLALSDSGFTRRKAFDLSGTAPNAGDIRGFAQLVKQDGSLSTLIQAAGNIYEWDGSSTFTLQGTVNSASQMRGSPYTQNFTLDEFVIITDLAKSTVVKKWDGTTFGNLAHNLGGDFFAKYCLVDNERALYANVTSGTDTPHVFVGSARSDSENLTVSNRPSTSLSEADPWFIPSPDLKPFNGLTEGFGDIVLSTEEGRIWKLTGSTAKDFAMDKQYLGSAANGNESIANVGNDIVFGRRGVIEALSGVQEYGDTAVDDISRWIQPDIEDVTSWTIVYDRRLQRVFCVPSGVGEMHVFHKVLSQSELSPWSLWTTSHTVNFEPTTIWAMKHPVDKTDTIYMGDSSGNIYQFDGTGGQDGGNADIAAFRTSGLVKTNLSQLNNVTGWVDYEKKTGASTLNITFEYAGTTLFDQAISLTLPAQDAAAVYSGAVYYGGSFYYGAQFERRLARQTYSAAGTSTEFQVKTEITGSNDFRLDELFVKFSEA